LSLAATAEASAATAGAGDYKAQVCVFLYGRVRQRPARLAAKLGQLQRGYAQTRLRLINAGLRELQPQLFSNTCAMMPVATATST
jgi:hypothetical protein